MSAIHMVAWGLVGVEGETATHTHKFLRAAVRKELREHGMGLVANGQKTFRLMGSSRRNDAMQRVPRKRLHSGTFVSCCEKASKLITPPNPTE